MRNALLLTLAVVAACTKSEPSSPSSSPSSSPVAGGVAAGPAVGTERGACKADRTCEGGLSCLSDVCVRSPVVDCGLIAHAIASVSVGEHAQKSERSALVANLEQQCEHASLSLDEARCLTSAASTAEIAKCPRPLLPELSTPPAAQMACSAVGTHLDEMVKAQLAANPKDPIVHVQALGPVLVSACDEDSWPDDVRRCMTAPSVTDETAVNRCVVRIPHDAQQHLAKRLEAMIAIVNRTAAAPINKPKPMAQRKPPQAPAEEPEMTPAPPPTPQTPATPQTPPTPQAPQAPQAPQTPATPPTPPTPQ